MNSTYSNKLLITDYRLPITDYRLPITDYRLPITDYRLLIIDYPLPITHETPPPPVYDHYNGSILRAFRFGLLSFYL